MIYLSREIETRPYIEYSENCLLIKFKDKFTEKASHDVCPFLENSFRESTGDEKFIMIWDCLEMSGFEHNAQKNWINFMNKNEDRVEKVIVVSENIVIRGAARLVLKIFSFESQVLKSYESLVNLQ